MSDDSDKKMDKAISLLAFNCMLLMLIGGGLTTWFIVWLVKH